MRPPLVSVVVIFLDAERFLSEAIESVLAQTFASWELILVNDGSSDRSGSIAADYVARQPDRIRSVAHEGGVNRGMSASRNLGLAHAHGRYVAFLDADDRWPPYKLATQTTLLEREVSLDVVFGSIRFFGDSSPGESFVWQPPVPHRVELDPAYLLRQTLLGEPPLLTTLGNPVIRRDALVAVGGLEDEFSGLAEDAVAWSKLAVHTRFAAIDDVVLEYRRHEEASGMIDRRSGILAAGRARFARWLYDYIQRQEAAVRAWALPIAREHLFRTIVLEAWQSPPEDPLMRRLRLVCAARELSRAYPETMTVRRRVRLAAQLGLGLRSGAIQRLQEQDLGRPHR
jgi:glycosyltransferase involved in cell wall biosynthesis